VSEQDEADGMKEEADSTGKMMHIEKSSCLLSLTF